MLKALAAILMITSARSVFSVYYSCWWGNDTFCTSCDTVNKKCLACANSYLDPLYNVCRSPSFNMTGCYRYDTHHTCNTPDYFYQLDDRGVAVPTFDQTCLISQNGTCIACSNSCNVPVGGNCSAANANSVNNCPVDKCEVCMGGNTCTRCVPGFTLYRNVCVPSNTGAGFANCLTAICPTCCTACNTGYFVGVNGICTFSRNATYYSLPQLAAGEGLALTGLFGALVTFFL